MDRIKVFFLREDGEGTLCQTHADKEAEEESDWSEMKQIQIEMRSKIYYASRRYSFLRLI
jgi:hypothetical protein